MKIENGWQFEDHVSGLRLTIIEGKKQDRLRIEHIHEPICDNRDFFFDKDGVFDGTGSGLSGVTC